MPTSTSAGASCDLDVVNADVSKVTRSNGSLDDNVVRGDGCCQCGLGLHPLVTLAT